MPDYPHLWTNMHKSYGYDHPGMNTKTWIHSPGKINQIHANSDYYKDHDIEKVAISDLIDWNDLNNEEVMKGKESTWGNKGVNSYRYTPSKDTDITDIISGARDKQGRIILNNGRHRIKALQNSGYTHVVIPVIDDKLAQYGEDLFKKYRSQNTWDMIDLRRNPRAFDPENKLTQEDIDYIRRVALKRKHYLESIENMRHRRHYNG